MTTTANPTTGTIHAGQDAGQEQRDQVPDEAARQREQPEQVAEEVTDLYGWLKEVNWAQRTAQFYRYSGEYVQLRFGAALDDEMRRSVKRHVAVRGHTRCDQDDAHPTVQVEQIRTLRAEGKPFDLEAFRNDPHPKVFDPDNIVTIDLTDEEWESYNRALRESREA